MFSQKLFLIFFLQFFVIISTQKSCKLKELDICISTNQINPLKIPKNSQQFDKQCQQIKDIQQCLEIYSKRCFSSLQKEMFYWISSPIWKSLESRCHDNHFREESYNHSQCLNQLSLSLCFRPIRDQLENKLNSTQICCSLKTTQKCIQNNNKCGQKSQIFLQKYLFFNEILNNFCLKELKCLELKVDKNIEKRTAFTRTLRALFGET